MMAKNLQTPRLFSMYTYEDINCDTSLMLKMTNLIFILAPSHERFFLADSSVCVRHFCPNRRMFCSTYLDVISNINGVRSSTYCHLFVQNHAYFSTAGNHKSVFIPGQTALFSIFLSLYMGVRYTSKSIE